MASATGATKARATRKKSARRSTPKRRVRASRYAVVYDIDGPRIRLGVGWFLLASAAMGGGPLGIAIVYGSAAAIGGAQAARAWRKRGLRPNEQIAGAGAGVLCVGAMLGPGGVGLACFALAAVASWFAFGDRRSRAPLGDAGMTIQCALPIGLAAASVVLTARYELWSAVALLLVVSAYETGDFVIGSGSHSPIEGPVAGGASVMLVSFIVGAIGLPPFDMGGALTFGVLAVVLCPLGQLLASAVLPASNAAASALRRLDSLLLLAPLWAWAIGIYVQSAS